MFHPEFKSNIVVKYFKYLKPELFRVILAQYSREQKWTKIFNRFINDFCHN